MVVGRSRPREDGAAAVEFALLAPLLFLILFGIIQYGFLFFQMQAASTVARNVARIAAAGLAGSDCSNFQLAVRQDAARNALPPGWSVQLAYANTPPDTVTVTSTFTPVRYVPFVPMPTTIPRTATARLEDSSRGAACGGTVTA